MRYRVTERSSEGNIYEVEAATAEEAAALVENGDAPDPVYNNIDLSEVVSAEPISPTDPQEPRAARYETMRWEPADHAHDFAAAAKAGRITPIVDDEDGIIAYGIGPSADRIVVALNAQPESPA